MGASPVDRWSGLHGGRLDLARAFMRDPLGRHGPELQILVDLMRAGSIEGKRFLFMVRPHRAWVIARVSTGPPARAELPCEPVYTNLEDAERALFRLRWRELFGRDLVV